MHGQKSSNRRQFLKGTGALATSGALVGIAGCLGGDDGDGGGGSAGNETLRNQYELPEFDFEMEDTLNVFQWTDYWPEGTVAKFEDAYGVTVNVSNYASNEEMFNKLKAGGTDQFDVIYPSDYMVNILADQDMVQELDMAKLPEWDNLESRWADNAPYDPGEGRYSTPYQWGTSGVGWHAGVTPDVTADSWDVLWDDSYEGQITMLDDPRETMGAALKRLGYSLNSKDEAEIQEAKELLLQQKPLLLTYDSVNMAENLQNESASPIHTWSGDAFVAYWELYSDGSSPIGYKVPEEGGVKWVDTAAITKEAKAPNAAHAFINFTCLNAQMNAEISNYVYYPSPNEAAKEFIFEDALNNEAIYPSDETLANLEFIRNLGEATTTYDEAWTEVKSA